MPVRSVTLKILGDDASGRASVDWATRAADYIDTRNPTLHIGADVVDASTKMEMIQALLEKLSASVANVRILADSKEAIADIAAFQVEFDRLNRLAARPKLSVIGMDRAIAGLTTLDLQMDKINAKVAGAHVYLDDSDAEGRLALLRVQLADLQRIASKINIPMDDGAALARLAELRAAMAAFSVMVKDENFDMAGLDIAEQRMGALAQMVNGLTTAEKAAGPPATKLLGTITLWGGLAATSGLHLLLDGIVELGAILVPATIALVTFGVALAATGPDLQIIYQRELNMYTATDILGKRLPGVTGSLTAMNQAVKPGVFQVWGDALNIVNSQSGAFAGVLQKAVSWVDQFAARITVDVQSGSGAFHTLLTDGEHALGMLANVFGSLGNAFMNLIRVSQETHIADILMGIVAAGARLLDLVTKLPTWLLAVVVGLHGVYLWGGLLVTGLTNAGTAVISFMAKMGVFKGITAIFPEAGAAITGFLQKIGIMEATSTDAEKLVAGLASGVGGVAKDAEAAGASSGFFAKALEAVGGPAGAAGIGVGLAALAIGGLVFWMSRSKDATQQWIDTMDAAISKASNATVFNTMANDVGRLDVKLGSLNQSWAKEREGIYQIGPASAQLGTDMQVTSGEIQKVTGQMYNFGTSAMYIMAKFHVDYPEALAIATQANVKLQNGILGTSKASKDAMQQVVGLVTGFEQLQTPAGMAGKDFEALAYASNDITSKIQQLNSAWDSWLKSVSGSQDSFDTFAQGLDTLKGASGGVTTRLGLLSTTSRYTKVNIDSLSASGLALNQAFVQEVSNLGSWADSMRTAGQEGGNLTNGLKAGIAALLPYAAGSKEATSQLYALAQQANYTGSDSISALAKWAGVKGTAALDDLKKASDKATISASNLANTISNLLNVQFQNDIVKSSGASTALQAYTTDLVHNRLATQQGQTDRTNLINDLEKAGMNAHQATTYVNNLNTAMGKMPHIETSTVKVYGEGNVSITGSGLTPGLISTLLHARPMSQGGRLAGFGGGDRIPAFLEAGETVVPKHLTPVVAPIMQAYGVPGFASGGIAGYSGGISGMAGFATQSYNKMSAGAIGATENVTKATLAAVNSAISALGSWSGGVATSAQVARWLSAALLITHTPMSWLGALERLVSKESGGNPSAIDPIAVLGQHATGLLQELPSTFAAYRLFGSILNPIANAVASIRYIRAVYGSPFNIPGLLSGSYHGYSSGGIISEPIFGIGLNSGMRYGFGENGIHERVTPLSPASGGGYGGTGGGITVNVYAHPSNNPDETARQIQQMLRDLKRHRGGQPLGFE